MNPGDIAAAGFHPGDVVDLYNYYGQTERVAYGFIIVSFQIPEKCTATYFPETKVLVPVNSVADKSNTPTSKLVIIKIKSSTIKK